MTNHHQRVSTSILTLTRHSFASGEEALRRGFQCTTFFTLNSKPPLVNEFSRVNNMQLNTSRAYEHTCTVRFTEPDTPSVTHSAVNSVVYVGTSTNMSFYTPRQNQSETLSQDLYGVKSKIYGLNRIATRYADIYKFYRLENWTVFSILNTSMNEAGLYVWTEPRYNTKHSSQLIVLGKFILL